VYVVSFVVLVYLENDRLERTVCLRCILLLNFGESAIKTSEMCIAAFGEQTVGRR
jgi:hypothetical protein